MDKKQRIIKRRALFILLSGIFVSLLAIIITIVVIAAKTI